MSETYRKDSPLAKTGLTVFCLSHVANIRKGNYEDLFTFSGETNI